MPLDSNALYDAILSKIQAGFNPREQSVEDLLLRIAPRFDNSNQGVARSGWEPQVEEVLTPLNSLFAGFQAPVDPAAVAEAPLGVSRSSFPEPVFNMITGNSKSFVDVPQTMAANTAMFQRTMPKNAPQGRVIYPPAQLPPIFQAIKEAQTGASSLSGYDPKNPPRAHTISKQQFMALPPLMQQQYLQATKERHGKIQSAKREYETLYGQTTQDAIYAASDKRRSEFARDENDAKIATQDLEAATQKQFAADTKLKDAAAKFADWRTKVDTAVARGWIRVDPKTKAITAIDKTVAGTAKAVDARIAERAQIETDIAEATKEQKAAAVEFGKAQDKARKVGVRASSSVEPASAVTPTDGFGQFREGQKIRRKDGTIWVVQGGRPVPLQ